MAEGSPARPLGALPKTELRLRLRPTGWPGSSRTSIRTSVQTGGAPASIIATATVTATDGIDAWPRPDGRPDDM